MTARPTRSWPRFAEIEVDVETGVYKIVDYLAVADVGTVMHPHSLGGQMHGGAVQGFGHVRSQRLVYDPHYGAALAKRMHNNKPPTILDIPLEMRWEAVELPDPTNPIGREGHRRAGHWRRRRRSDLCARRRGGRRHHPPDAGAARADHDVAGGRQTGARTADGVHLGRTDAMLQFAT